MQPEAPVSTGEETRRADVTTALSTVLDPELDEPLTDLGFINDIRIEDDRVLVALRLPTFWCSANFAYIMGEDIKAAVGDLRWVSQVIVTLTDHFAMHKINAGLAAGQSFREVFGAEAEDDLHDVRADFKTKSFVGRQATIIQALRREKRPPEEIAAMTIGDLETRAATAGAEFARQIARYLEARRDHDPAASTTDVAFLTAEGRPVAPDALLDHLREARKIRGSFEANAEMCRILLAARYGDRPAPIDPSPVSKSQEDTQHVAC